MRAATTFLAAYGLAVIFSTAGCRGTMSAAGDTQRRQRDASGQTGCPADEIKIVADGPRKASRHGFTAECREKSYFCSEQPGPIHCTADSEMKPIERDEVKKLYEAPNN